MTVTVTLGTRATNAGGDTLAPSISCTVGDLIVVGWCASKGDSTTTGYSPPSGWSAAENPDAPAGGSGTYQPISGIFYKIAASTTETCTIPGIVFGSYGYADILKASSDQGTFQLDVHANNGAASGVTSASTGATGTISNSESLVVAMLHSEDQIGAVTNHSFPPGPSGFTDWGHDQSNSVVNSYCSGYKTGVTASQNATASWTTNAGYSACIASFVVPSSGGTNVNLTGVSATGSVGSVTSSRTVALTGVTTTGTQGNVTFSRTIPLTGVTGTASQGALAAAVSTTLVSVTATGTVGTVTYNVAGGPVTVALAGVSATGSVGTVLPSIVKAISGVPAFGSVGTVTASGGSGGGTPGDAPYAVSFHTSVTGHASITSHTTITKFTSVVRS